MYLVISLLCQYWNKQRNEQHWIIIIVRAAFVYPLTGCLDDKYPKTEIYIWQLLLQSLCCNNAKENSQLPNLQYFNVETFSGTTNIQIVFDLSLCVLKHVIDYHSQWVPYISFQLLKIMFLTWYTRFFMQPHKNKSNWVRCSDLGGHEMATPLPIHLSSIVWLRWLLIKWLKYGSAPYCWKTVPGGNCRQTYSSSMSRVWGPYHGWLREEEEKSHRPIMH